MHSLSFVIVCSKVAFGICSGVVLVGILSLAYSSLIWWKVSDLLVINMFRAASLKGICSL